MVQWLLQFGDSRSKITQVERGLFMKKWHNHSERIYGLYPFASNNFATFVKSLFSTALIRKSKTDTGSTFGYIIT